MRGGGFLQSRCRVYIILLKKNAPFSLSSKVTEIYKTNPACYHYSYEYEHKDVAAYSINFVPCNVVFFVAVFGQSGYLHVFVLCHNFAPCHQSRVIIIRDLKKIELQCEGKTAVAGAY